MNFKLKPSEAGGQIIILFAVGLVGLIGFAALAIDGGMILAERRANQSVADAAAMAGAGAAAKYMQAPTTSGDKQVFDADFACNSAAVTHAMNAAYAPAVARAAANGFTIATEPPADSPNGVWVTCNASKRRIEVKVVITKTVQTSFAAIFTGGAIQNTVTASGEADPLTTLAQGNAIASLSPNCGNPTSTVKASDGGLWFGGGGSSQIRVTDGGIFSNSCLESVGGTYVVAQDGTIAYVTTEDIAGNSHYFSPTPVQAEPISVRTISMTNCGAVQDVDFKNGYKKAGHTLTISPGTYNSNSKTVKSTKPAIEGGGSGTTLIMRPGLYCLNGDFEIGSGSTVKVEGYPLNGEHDGVTIYLVKPGVTFNSGGNATVQLQACTMKDRAANICPSGAVTGLLLYAIPVSPVNSGLINMGGTPSSIYEGSVYAPTSWIDMGGNPSTESNYNTEVIGYVITLHGNVAINIHYDSALLYHNPASVSVMR